MNNKHNINLKVGDIVECTKDLKGQFTGGHLYVVRSIDHNTELKQHDYDMIHVLEDDSGSLANGWCRLFFRYWGRSDVAQIVLGGGGSYDI